jgi:dTDP-4-dehydrorhamnose 3,5-epimerase
LSRFEEIATDIEGIFTVTKNKIGDDRGFLERLFCVHELHSWSNRPLAQVNRTFTAKKGTMRGLHFQQGPFAEAKFICCLKGKVTDIALDLRKTSKTYGHVFSIRLDSELHNAVLLPEGVAHGFQSLTDNVEMLYFHSQPYSSAYEAGVNILDPSLEVNWELPCQMISDRDKNFPYFKNLKGLIL